MKTDFFLTNCYHCFLATETVSTEAGWLATKKNMVLSPASKLVNHKNNIFTDSVRLWVSI